MEVIDPGHIYDLWQLGSPKSQRKVYVKRSGGAITYPEEWPGIQVQEDMRAIIDRCQYLNDIIPCAETTNAIYHARMVIFEFEARAYRRKQEKVNRESPEHDDTSRFRDCRDLPYDDVPFNEHEIELRPIGSDGHILIEEFT